MSNDVGQETESPKIGQMERIQILLAEYASLRSEMNVRISSFYVVAGWSTIFLVWFISQPSHALSSLVGFVIWIIGTVYCVRVLGFDATNTTRRVREIEHEINRRVGEKLLIWESERGGLNRSYWRRLFFLQRT
jgi:hypothetical protein